MAARAGGHQQEMGSSSARSCGQAHPSVLGPAPHEDAPAEQINIAEMLLPAVPSPAFSPWKMASR